MRSLLRDLRYAVRSLRKSRGLALVAVLALTLGIGLTTTMFSIVYGAMLRGLPVEEGSRIVDISRTSPTREIRRMAMPIHDFVEYAAQQRSFEGIAALYEGTVNVSGTERAERYQGAFVTANTFDLLRVRPILGRGFRPGEDAPTAEKVAVIGHAMWRDHFRRDPQVIGTTLRANGTTYTIIGVMPERFAFPETQQIWLPLGLDPVQLERGQGSQLAAFARLKPGVTVEQATADVSSIARRLQVEHKATNEHIDAVVEPWMESHLGPEPRRLLMTMLGAVTFVLLIACANVANLLLDRAAHRTKEVGIRTALGASRGAVVRQFLAEALVLSATGALLGLGLAYAGVVLFNAAIADTQPPYWIDIALHPPVLLFVAAVAALATLASGALPAIQSSRADIGAILKDESRGSSSFRIGRMSRALVVFEIALSCGLLVAAGLMIKSVAKLRTMDPGFDARSIVTARLGFPSTYTDTLRQVRFFEELEARLATLPGVRSATLASGLPGVGGGGDRVAIEGRSYATERDYPRTRHLTVGAPFFETFGIRATAGRVLGAGDRAGAMPTVVVNESFARQHFARESPLGRRIRLGGADTTRAWMTIVGVVPDTYTGDASEPRGAVVFRPMAQHRANFASMAVRASGGDALALTPRIRALVASLDADIPLYWVYSMEEALERPTWFVRVFGTIFMIFGVVALFLAGLGLYAVMAFSVSRRVRDVGIRMALGARAGHVLRMIVGQGVRQLAVGMVLGLALAAGVSRLLSDVLFDVQPRDPAIFAAVVAVLTLAGLLASLVPALRAVRVDPIVALRSE